MHEACQKRKPLGFLLYLSIIVLRIIQLRCLKKIVICEELLLNNG